LDQHLTGGADRVQRVGLAAAAGRPGGPVDLNHPLATVDQHPRQPSAIAAGTFNRKAAATRDMDAGEGAQAPVADCVRGDDQLPKQPTDRGNGGRAQGVAVSIDTDDAVHLVSQRGHAPSFQEPTGSYRPGEHRAANL